MVDLQLAASALPNLPDRTTGKDGKADLWDHLDDGETIDVIADGHQVAVGIVRKWVRQALAQIGAALDLEHAEPTD